MYSRLLGDDATKGDILKGIKSNIEANKGDYAKSGGKILSAGAEGAMLELAVRFGAQGAQKTIGRAIGYGYLGLSKNKAQLIRT